MPNVASMPEAVRCESQLWGRELPMVSRRETDIGNTLNHTTPGGIAYLLSRCQLTPEQRAKVDRIRELVHTAGPVDERGRDPTAFLYDEQGLPR